MNMQRYLNERRNTFERCARWSLFHIYMGDLCVAATAAAARPISPCTDVYLYDYRYVNDLHTSKYLVYITYICVYTPALCMPKFCRRNYAKKPGSIWNLFSFTSFATIWSFCAVDDCFNIYTKYIRINSSSQSVYFGLGRFVFVAERISWALL